MLNVGKHNLNLQMYSFNELLELFQLPINMNIYDLKRAKKQVLMLHPDKSKLPPEYFLFYKKAFDMIVVYFENNSKETVVLTDENTVYKKMDTTDFNKATCSKIHTMVNEMSPIEFHSKFNELYEKNMVESKPNKNEWFSNNEPIYTIDETVSNKNIGRIFETMKKQNHGIIQYEGVKEIVNDSIPGNSFYDDEYNSNLYVSSNPFSKLKYDDLRKVHKDQSIFSVSESDYKSVPKYSSVEHFVKERSRQPNKPFDKQQSESILLENERIYKEQIANRLHQSKLKTQMYVEKNKAVLSSFLQIK
jgi:hypothetical protein